jgi:hypothetical protein
MMQEGVHQCTVGMTGAWVYDHARGFVDHKKMFLLMHNVHRDVLGGGLK